LEIEFVFGTYVKWHEGHKLIITGHCFDHPVIYLNQYTEFFIERTITHEILHHLLHRLGIDEKYHHFAIKEILFKM